MDATCTIQNSIHVFRLVRQYVSRILGTYHFAQVLILNSLNLLFAKGFSGVLGDADDGVDEIADRRDVFPVHDQRLRENEEDLARLDLVRRFRNRVDVRRAGAAADPADELSSGEADSFVEIPVEQVVAVIVKPAVNVADVLLPARLEHREIGLEEHPDVVQRVGPHFRRRVVPGLGAVEPADVLVNQIADQIPRIRGARAHERVFHVDGLHVVGVHHQIRRVQVGVNQTLGLGHVNVAQLQHLGAEGVIRPDLLGQRLPFWIRCVVRADGLRQEQNVFKQIAHHRVGEGRFQLLMGLRLEVELRGVEIILRDQLADHRRDLRVDLAGHHFEPPDLEVAAVLADVEVVGGVDQVNFGDVLGRDRGLDQHQPRFEGVAFGDVGRRAFKSAGVGPGLLEDHRAAGARIRHAEQEIDEAVAVVVRLGRVAADFVDVEHRILREQIRLVLDVGRRRVLCDVLIIHRAPLICRILCLNVQHYCSTISQPGQERDSPTKDKKRTWQGKEKGQKNSSPHTIRGELILC